MILTVVAAALFQREDLANKESRLPVLFLFSCCSAMSVKSEISLSTPKKVEAQERRTRKISLVDAFCRNDAVAAETSCDSGFDSPAAAFLTSAKNAAVANSNNNNNSLDDASVDDSIASDATKATTGESETSRDPHVQNRVEMSADLLKCRFCEWQARRAGWPASVRDLVRRKHGGCTCAGRPRTYQTTFVRVTQVPPDRQDDDEKSVERLKLRVLKVGSRCP